MRFYLIAAFAFIGFQSLKAQDSLAHRLDPGRVVHLDIYAGFNRSPIVDGEDRAFHSVEFGIAKSMVITRYHGGSGTLYLGQELGLWNDKLLHGTKAGAWMSYSMFTMGAEIAHLTDYQRNAFNLWPSFGIGVYPLKMSVATRVRLTGDSFQPQNKVSFNLTYMLFRFSEKSKD